MTECQECQETILFRSICSMFGGELTNLICCNCYHFQQVSLFGIQGSNLIYQKRITSEISAGIISLQFESCNLQGFEKNVLAIATKDSSILALDSETGNTLSASNVHPKKPSRALFMQILCKIYYLSLSLIMYRRIILNLISCFLQMVKMQQPEDQACQMI